jgi:hypothetical protein
MMQRDRMIYAVTNILSGNQARKEPPAERTTRK